MQMTKKRRADSCGYSLKLRPESAADLMTPNPVSVEVKALVSEAVVLLTERGFSAAPVIDEAGRPIGVVSRTDLLIHEREQAGRPQAPSWYDDTELRREFEQTERTGLHVERVDDTRVGDVMTPIVFGVEPDCAVSKVVEEITRLNVHRLFVIDADGTLVGVISALDVLRCLCRD